MGKFGFKGKGKGSGKQAWKEKGKDEERRDYLKAVESRYALAKALLRPYASETGSPFFGNGQTDSDLLSLKSLAAAMQPDTSELCNRLGIALSEAGGTISMGKELLEKYAADGAGAAKALGIQGAAELLGSDAGRKFAAAAAAFNKHDVGADKSAAALKIAAERWVAFVSDDPSGKAKNLQRLAKASAKLYLFAVEMLQWLAAGKDRGAWAKKLKAQKSLQPESVQSWLRAPSDADKLSAALVGAYRAQVAATNKKAQALSDEEDPEAQAEIGSAASSASSSSSSGKKRKKKAKKAAKDAKAKSKKVKKKAKSSSSGASNKSRKSDKDS